MVDFTSRGFYVVRSGLVLANRDAPCRRFPIRRDRPNVVRLFQQHSMQIADEGLGQPLLFLDGKLDSLDRGIMACDVEVIAHRFTVSGKSVQYQAASLT